MFESQTRFVEDWNGITINFIFSIIDLFIVIIIVSYIILVIVIIIVIIDFVLLLFPHGIGVGWFEEFQESQHLVFSEVGKVLADIDMGKV